MIKKILFIIFFIGLYQTAFAQAPGADCTTATPLTLLYGSTMSTGLQSNAGMGNNYPVGTSNACGVNGLHGNAEDGVYSIDVAVAGDYTFAFANTVGATVWNSLAVHSGCPPNNGNCADATRGFFTGTQRDGSTTTTLTPGTYYIVIDSFVTITPAASFELLITSPITNDDCSGAAELFSTVDCDFVTYTNTDATASVGAPAPTCGNYLGGDVWFTYEVNSTGEFTVTTEANVMTDSGMAVYSGNCGTLTQISCNDDFFGFASMSSITLTGRTPGEIIYIRLWEYGNDNNGTFEICVTTPLPPGDSGVYSDCPNERGLELTSDFTCPPGINASDTVFGNLEGAPTAFKPNGIPVNSAVCNFSTAGRRYEEINFTVPTTGAYVFELTAASGFDAMGYIVEQGFTPGVCGPGFVRVDDDSGAGNYPEISATLTMGTAYTLITTEYFGPGSGNSPYTWTVTSGPDVNWETVFPIEWYTTASGGTPIETGPGFSPVNFPGSGLTDTGTPGIYTFWYECSSAPGTRYPVDYVIGKVWDGSTSSDWNTASNWSNDELPTDYQCVFIPAGTPNDPVLNDNDNGDGLNLTIGTGATLTLASDVDTNNFASSLTIQDHIAVQGTGVLTVENDASLIQVNDTPSIANSGDIDLYRTTNVSRYDYVYWSSPVQGFDVSDVYGVNTPLSYTFEWIPTIATGTFAPGVLPTGGMPICFGNWALRSVGSMNSGKGYAVRGPSDHSTTIPSAENTLFSGVPNNGVITQPISSGGNSFVNSDYANSNGIMVTPFDDNWNLLGNPYPSALDANAFLTHPSNAILEGSVHIWTHGTPIGANGDSFYEDFAQTYSVLDYITYNFSGTNTYTNETFAGKIASGQGFFVVALNDNEAGSVTFNNSMRDRTHSNTDFYRTAETNDDVVDSEAIEKHRIWLNLIAPNGLTSSILVGYIAGATQEKDRLYDAYVREVNSLSMYSKIGDERMLIQGRALPFDNHDQVPLGAVIPQAGEYTIAISNVDGLFLDDNQEIYLEDTLTGVIHNLRATPYTFTETESIDYEDRFLLRYTDDALSINDLELSTISIKAPKGSYIKINSDNNNPIETVIVYDLLGRALIDNSSLHSSEFVINNHNLSSGTYIVKVTLNNGVSKTQKVVLKR